MITAFIPNYKRPANVRKIIPALRNQTVNPRIVLVDNAQYTSLKNVTGINDQPDDLWRAPFNVGPFYKFLVAKHYDGWLYFNDDDVIPKENDYIERLIDKAEEGWRIVGPRARTVISKPPYYKGLSDTTGPTNNVKMLSAVMHREWLNHVRIPPADWLLRNDDIWVSLEVSRGMKCLYGARFDIADMSQKNTGLSHESEHYKERSEGVRYWFECFS
jgi:hypothetical protein